MNIWLNKAQLLRIQSIIMIMSILVNLWFRTKQTTTTTFNDDSVGTLKRAVESLIEEVTSPKREA